MIVIFLGAPGSGKGTQSKRIGEKHSFQHLATGDIFRSEISQGTPLGQKAQDYVKSGKLVPDAVVTEMVAARLEPGGKYVLDGFPRNLEQAQALDGMLERSQSSIDLVFYLMLSKTEAIRRMTSRRICSNCGEVYNVVTRPPKSSGVCDRCGGPVVQREDDSESTAAKRYMVFEDLTQPLVAYYKAERPFHEIDASRSPEEVEQALSTVIESVGPVR